MLVSKSNILWIGTVEGGINKLDLKEKIFKSYNYNPNIPKSIGQNIVNTIFEDKTGKVWIGSWGSGLFEFDPKTGEFKQYFTKSKNSNLANTINSICEDKNGQLWIGTDEGISILDKSRTRFENMMHDPNNQNTLSIDNVKTIYCDKSGNIWVGTWGGGMNKYNPAEKSFTHYQSIRANVQFVVDMSGVDVSSSGVYIAGSMNGWNPSKDKLTHVGNHIYTINMELAPGRTEYKYLNGNTWGKEEKLTGYKSDYNNRTIYIRDRDIILDTVLFGKGAEESYSIDPKGVYKDKKNIISSDKIWVIREDEEGNLWLGTDNGLDKFDVKTASFTTYKNTPGNLNSLSDNNVSYIHFDIENNLWIGTLGGGLCMFNKDSSIFKTYTENDGLPNNMIKGILSDNRDHLWISTSSGLCEFDYRKKVFRNYDVNDGLNDNNFRNGACLRSKNGYLYFGGSNGFSVFYPDSVSDAFDSPSIYFTDLKIFNETVFVGELQNGRTILKKSLVDSKEIKLSYKDYVFSIEFTALYYQAPQKIKYAYKLEGFDKDWIETDYKHRIATYTNLDGGSYTFKVKSTNNDGVWSDKIQSIKIIITPPFWKTIWFRIFIFIVLFVSLYFLYQLRMKANERKQKREMLLAERKIMHLEKEKLEAELDHKSKELSSLTMHLVNRNKILSEQKNQLEMLSIKAENSTQQRLIRLIDDIDKEINIDKDWEYIELHFDKVYQSFLGNLKNKFPELTSTDIQLCAYIRMGLSTKEIADLMHKTIRGENDRYRLRKNLDIDKFTNLKDFLFDL
jgi:streptogramin lyase